MRKLDAAVGSFFALGAMATLPAVLALSAAPPDAGLHVTLTNGRTHVVVSARAVSDTGVEVEPLSIRARLIARGGADFEGPGLALRRWSLSYGHRWDREVVLPVLRGPFDRVGTPWPCALGLRIAPQLLDRGAGVGNDLATAIARRLADLFPRDAGTPPFSLHFPESRTITLRITTESGALHGHYVIALVDGTTFRGGVRLRFEEHDGDLVARPEVTSFDWTGGSRTDWRLRVVDLFSGVVDRRARAVAEQRIHERVAEIFDDAMDRIRRPFGLSEDRPGDQFELRFCGPPHIDTHGMAFTLGATVRLQAPRIDAGVDGPVHLDDTPRWASMPAARGDVEVVGSAAIAQQAMYVLWQSGRLGAWGRNPRAIDDVRGRIADRLTATIDSLDPRLPPTITLEPTAGQARWRIRVADLGIGHDVDARRVRAHGDAVVRVADRNGVIGIRGTFADLRIDCAAGEGTARATLWPCLSDVVMAVRAEPGGGIPLEWWLDERVLDRFLRVRLDGALALELTHVRSTMDGTPASARLSADARFVAGPTR